MIANPSNNESDICVLSPVSATGVTSDNFATTIFISNDNIPKTVRDKFFLNIKTFEKNWSGECVLCHEIKYDKLGVTSNINRHVRTKHAKAYEEWSSELRSIDANNTQKKYRICLLEIVKQREQHYCRSLHILLIIHDKFNYLSLLLEI